MYTIREIFSNKIFRIPDYQRGYSWEKEHLDDFWQDLNNLNKDRVHYTGMISVEEVDKAEFGKWNDDKWIIEGRNYKPYFIVDGQQRLTTIIILLWVIINSIDETEELSYDKKSSLIESYIYSHNEREQLKSYIFGYHKDNPSYEFLKQEIFEQNLDNSELEETSYTNNLLYAKSYFKRKIASLNHSQKSVLYDKITKKLKFDFKVLEKELDIFIVFETMNNRGKPLTNLEKLKNRLIYLSTLLDEDNVLKKELRDNINEHWKIVYKYLGLNKERKLDDDAFLQNHWIVFHRYERREPEFYATDIFDRIFTSQQVLSRKVGFKDIKIYIESISESVKQWFVMFNPTHHHALELTQSEELLYWLKKQNIIGFKAFQPLIMSALLTDNSSELKTQLVKSTESYVFLLFNISMRRSNTGTYHFNAKANELYKNELTITEIIRDLRFWIYGTEDFPGYFDRDNFYNYLKDLFQRDTTNGYADWKDLKYLLYEYELHLQNGDKEADKISYGNTFVQNISPYVPEKQCWRNSYLKLTRREKKLTVGSLGNFVLSTRKLHAGEERCYDVIRDLLQNGLLNEKLAANYDEWDYNTILQRGLDVLSFVEKRWNINLGNENNKKELLFLDLPHFVRETQTFNP